MNRPFKNLLDDDWVEHCDNLWELLTGIILDTRTPLRRLYRVVFNLKNKDLLDFRKLRRYSVDKISGILKEAGYIWYNQKANFLNQEITFDLKTASYEDMLTIKGIGNKLASLWMAIVHNSNKYPILDTHVLKFLKLKGYNQKNYASLSEAFKKEANLLGLSVLELDKKILNDGIKRVKNN